MKILLTGLLALASLSTFTECKAAPVYCVGQIAGAEGYASIFGAFSYHFWCANGLHKEFPKSGCYTNNCQDRARQSLEKNELPALGFKFLGTTDLDQFQEKLFIYTEIKNERTDLSNLDLAHAVTRHTGFRNNPDRTTFYISKSGKRSEVDFGASDSSEYLNFLFRDDTLIQKISRDTPHLQRSEFYLYNRNH